jgi:chromosome segregation ATPase
MSNSHRFPTLVLALLILVGAGLAASSKAIENTQTSPRSQDPLLEEVRALRADLQRAATIGVRAQLLMGRLQVQEQRVTAVGVQLAEIRRQIELRQTDEAALSERIDRYEHALRDSTMDSGQRREIEDQLPVLKAQAEKLQSEQITLRNRESGLSGQLANAQSLWMNFNNRLDELEAELSTLRH